eukprot:Ihof_evm4s591 gene=Ihof_evmTU4s591
MSSMETEFIALAEVIKNTVWLKNVLLFLGYESSPVTIFKNYISTIVMANSNGTMRKTKHVQLQYNFVKDNIDQGIIVLQHVTTSAQQADIATKVLAPAQFLHVREMLHLAE